MDRGRRSLEIAFLCNSCGKKEKGRRADLRMPRIVPQLR